MYCKQCAKLSLRHVLGSVEGTFHKPSFAALSRSADDGCQLCVLFRSEVIGTDMYNKRWSEQEACEYQDRLDSVGETYFMYLRSLTFSDDPIRLTRAGCNGITYRRWPYKDGGSNAGLTNVQLSLTSATAKYGLVSRPVAPKPKFELAKEWLGICASSHRSCLAIQDLPLPTRLIDVGSDSHTEPRLVVTRGSKGKYVTLSHCWGGSSKIVTDRLSYQKHLVAIPYSTLPRTFQDAVTTVRELGYQYLWIDCFCIIQGDNDDWERECMAMDGVFENLAFTISGPNAGDTEAGFLHPRPEPALPPVALPRDKWRWWRKEVVTMQLKETQQLDHREERENCALAKRAWILQERLLSPRVLSFAKSQMFFECKTADSYESYWRPIVTNGGYIGGGAMIHKSMMILGQESRAPGSARKEAFTADSIWHRIVITYSKCDLTRRRDKLPALSGIAKRFATIKQDKYLAGLWHKSLINDLAWHLRSPEFVQRKPEEPPETIPSWSWASRQGSIAYIAFGRPLRSGVKVHTALVSVRGSNEFGEVLYGDLALIGRVRTFTLDTKVTPCVVHARPKDFVRTPVMRTDDHEGGTTIYSSNGPRENLYFYPDVKDDCWSLAGHELACMYLGSFGADAWVALAFGRRQTDLPGFIKYRRLGLVMRHPNSTDIGAGTFLERDWKLVDKRYIYLV